MHVAGGPETITATDAAATLTAATLTAAALREKCVHIGGKVASRVKRIELDVDGEGGGRQERGEDGTVQASSACKTRSYELSGGRVFFSYRPVEVFKQYQVQVLRTEYGNCTPVYSSETDSRSRHLWMLLSMGLRPSSSSLPAMNRLTPLELRRRRKESLKKAMLKVYKTHAWLLTPRLTAPQRGSTTSSEGCSDGLARPTENAVRLSISFHFTFISISQSLSGVLRSDE